jgi:FAD/FMN-containing dehydrogenase
MTPAQQAMLDALAPRLGPRAIHTDPDAIAPWLSDWRGRFHGAAPALLSPASTAEVALIVAAAAAHRVPLVAQGGNSSMVGGATPAADGSAVLLSLRRMDKVHSISRDAMRATVEAGVVLDRLQQAAAEVALRFPLTLGARGTATVGGLVSTNAGGTQVLRFGTMRGLVLGVEAVLADGSVHDGTAALAKDNRGYSLDQLMIGAEGTLGIVTAATLKLVPAVAARTVAWAAVADSTAALTLLRRFQHASDQVESFELIPGDTLAAALAYLPAARSPLSGTHPWHVLIEATSPDAAASPQPMVEAVMAGALAEGLIADATIAASEAQADAFWAIRDSLSAAERARGPAAQHDIAVPVDAMPRFLKDAVAACEARFPGTHAGGFGHLGDGNIHFHVRAPAGADPARWYRHELPAVNRFVHDLVVAEGGTISAEHGIGQMKRAELARLDPPGRLAAMRAIKRALDPLGILNPGKIIDLAPPDGAP